MSSSNRKAHAISIVVASNREWLWQRLFRQLDAVLPWGDVIELVLVGDGPSTLTHPAVRYIEVAPGTKVGEKFFLGAKEARGGLVAFRSDDSIWLPNQFTTLLNEWRHRHRPPYVGWGHGWFWAPHLHPEHTAAFRNGVVIPGTSLIDFEFAATVPWAHASGEVPVAASDTVFMQNLIRRCGERPPCPSGNVYGLWLFHGDNIWDRSRYKYTVPLTGLTERVPPLLRNDWHALIEDARNTILEHRKPSA